MVTVEQKAVQPFPTLYLEQIDREVGQTPAEYLPMLLQLIRIFRQSVALKPAAESFRQGWQEALAGETLPVADLWFGVDTE
jgi:hypothetical protein